MKTALFSQIHLLSKVKNYNMKFLNVQQFNFFFAGLLIFRGKKSKISWDFQGQIRGKIGQFRGIFAGKKSKFVEQSADFAGEKSKFAEKSADFAGF